jgi:hypothetical protein
MLNLFQHLIKVFPAFGKRIIHPLTQGRAFRCGLYKKSPRASLGERGVGGILFSNKIIK